MGYPKLYSSVPEHRIVKRVWRYGINDLLFDILCVSHALGRLNHKLDFLKVVKKLLEACTNFLYALGLLARARTNTHGTVLNDSPNRFLMK